MPKRITANVIIVLDEPYNEISANRIYCHGVFHNHIDPNHQNGQWSIIIEFNEITDQAGFNRTAEMCFLVDEAPHNRLQEINNNFILYYGDKKIGKGYITASYEKDWNNTYN